MSKRKNTLNDLEEFLKLQASTLAAPKPVDVPHEVIAQPVAETFKPVEAKPVVEVVEKVVEKIVEKIVQVPAVPVDIQTELQKIASRDRSEFFGLVLKTLDTIPQTQSKDALLINTLLYLKHGDNWKSGIENYWKAKV
jgi:hypothetical protein